MVLNWKRLLWERINFQIHYVYIFVAHIGEVCLRKTLGSSPGLPMLILHQSYNHSVLLEAESERNHM